MLKKTTETLFNIKTSSISNAKLLVFYIFYNDYKYLLAHAGVR